MITGTFTRSIDDKFRVAVPKRLREALDCRDGGGLYVAPGTDGSLAIHTEESFRQLAERLSEASPAKQEVRDFTRLFYGLAQRVELDGQGRIRIPKDLAERAELTKECVLVGLQDHLELWAAGNWQKYLAEKQTHFDEIAEAAFGRQQ